MKVIVSLLGNIDAELNQKDVLRINTNELFAKDPENWKDNFISKLNESLLNDNGVNIIVVDAFIETLEIMRSHGFKFLIILPSNKCKPHWFGEMKNQLSVDGLEYTEDELEVLYNEVLDFEYCDSLTTRINGIEDISYFVREMILSKNSVISHHDFSWVAYNLQNV